MNTLFLPIACNTSTFFLSQNFFIHISHVEPSQKNTHMAFGKCFSLQLKFICECSCAINGQAEKIALRTIFEEKMKRATQRSWGSKSFESNHYYHLNL